MGREAGPGRVAGVAYPARVAGSPDSGGPGGGGGLPGGGEAGKPFNAKRAVAVGVVAAVVIAGVGLGAYVMTGDVPRGIRMLGLDLGATSRTEAEHRLRDHIAAHVADPVRVRLDGQLVQFPPAEGGLAVDVDASVGAAMRAGVRLIGSRDVAPVVRVDRVALEAALRGRIAHGHVTMRKPGITFHRLSALPSYPESGLDLDPGVAVDRIRAAWPVGLVADVPLVPRTPVTTKAQVEALIAGLAKPAVAAPVTVTVGAKSFRLAPAAIAKGLVFRADDDGRLTPVVDGARLHAAAAAGFATVETAPVSAGVALAGSRPRIVASTPGELVDLGRLGADLLTVLPRPAPRAVTGTLVRSEAATTDADLVKLGVKERVSTFTTFFTGGRRSPRSQNIITVAAAVDGALVQPGETFSLNAHTGERNYAAGYHDAPVIVGGRLEPGVGGGASQFTTTLFNAAYYAGLQDVEHKPHSFYFSRYPAVIESTIFYPTLDLRFKNITPYGILIDTATTGRSVTVSLWSTKVYDSVETEYGPRRRATTPPTVYRPAGPRCITSSGLPGFTQDAWRVIRKDGRRIAREKFSWRYDPEPRFVCGTKPSS
ncbi:VanW family protein [Micromonosporaceae bacterium Da 78-11]